MADTLNRNKLLIVSDDINKKKHMGGRKRGEMFVAAISDEFLPCCRVTKWYFIAVKNKHSLKDVFLLCVNG